MTGVNIKIVKTAKKDYNCDRCPTPIKQGEMYISAFGFDYDNDKVNEKIHTRSECYEEWVSGIDMVDADDIKKLIEDAQRTAQGKCSP